MVQQWRRDMDKRHVTIAAIFLTALLLTTGCPRQNPDIDYRGTVSTPFDIQKAQLLEKLDKKWESPDTHFQLGQLYHAQGIWEKAEYHYNIALGFDPVHRDAQAATVKVLADSGDRTKSQITADLYISQASSTAGSLLGLGLGFQRQQLDQYALQCYNKALSMAPNSATVNRQMGYFYLSRKDNARAKEFLTRSFQLNPNQPDVANELGRLGVEVRIPGSRTNEKDLNKIVN